jgi:glycosyltransferase involved in cell wall biosynthesis
MDGMRICYFGDYNPEYIRNSVIIEGLKENNVEVTECNISPFSVLRHARLLWCYLRRTRGVEMIFVGSSDTSRWMVVLAKLLSLGRIPVVWDAHYSIYDAYVNDKKLIPSSGFKAKYYYSMEVLACALANVVLLDTNEHIKYFVKTFGAAEGKFIKVLVGSNLSSLPPAHLNSEKHAGFLVSFHGKYIPLQGVDFIIRAAKILEKQKDIHFRMIGGGQMYVAARTLAEKIGVRNIEFISFVPYKLIPAYLKEADISLGIFGDTQKTQRVIPNKVYEAIEVGVPVLTADTPAIRELFTENENIFLCRCGDAEDLARKILQLKDDPESRKRVAINGKKLFMIRTTPEAVGKQLLSDLACYHVRSPKREDYRETK